MSAANHAHNLITVEIATELNIQLRGRGNDVYANAMRVRSPTGCYFYPDVVVVCDNPRFEDNVFDRLCCCSIRLNAELPFTVNGSL